MGSNSLGASRVDNLLLGFAATTAVVATAAVAWSVWMLYLGRFDPATHAVAGLFYIASVVAIFLWQPKPDGGDEDGE